MPLFHQFQLTIVSRIHRCSRLCKIHCYFQGKLDVAHRRKHHKIRLTIVSPSRCHLVQNAPKIINLSFENKAEFTGVRKWCRISWRATSPGRSRGARSLNKQNPECALPRGATRGPGARAGGPQQRTGGPERAFPKPFACARHPSAPSDSQDAGHTLGCDRNYEGKKSVTP